MATLKQQLERSQRLTSDIITKNLFDFIRSIEKEVVEKNVEQIHDHSIDIFGNALGFYSEATEEINPEKKAGDPFTGKDTGEWLEGFGLTIAGTTIAFSSKDYEKTQLIKSRNSSWLSNQLFGLTDENLRELIQTRMLPFLIQRNRETLNI